jgi:hypothetical protein
MQFWKKRPLEGLPKARFLLLVQDHLLRHTSVTGLIAASATSGALVAMGRRAGSATAGFDAIGRFVMSGSGPVWLPGLTIHVLLTLAWAFLFGVLTERRRWSAWRAAASVGAVSFLLSWIAARTSGGGLAIVLPIGDRVVLAIVLAVSLVVGMRFALPAREMHE